MSIPFPKTASDGSSFTYEGITYFYNTHLNEWSRGIEERCNYNAFWRNLLSTKFYKIFRKKATESLLVNITFKEFTCYILEARDGKPDIQLIQSLINQIFLVFDDIYHPAQDPDVISGFSRVFDESGMDVFYSYPNKQWVEDHTYDPITNTIAGKQPFPSWELVLARWEPPFMPPNDGKNYIWSEEEKNWIESEPPYPSWTVIEGKWTAPVYKPNDGNEYTWDEKNQSWIST